jgi:hypothetical protein
METIKNYLDNMFANLPKTSEMLKVKNDLLSNMEEKYNELKNEGKSENEAIGIVISEFGNIDELISELGINYETRENMLPAVTREDAEVFMAAKRKSGLLIGIGVFLCILSPAVLMLLNTLAEDGIIGSGLSKDFRDMLGLIGLFILVVPAVALFIYTGMKMERYKFLNGAFDLPLSAKNFVQQKHDSFASTFTFAIIAGVSLCILSPIALFISSAFDGNADIYGVIVLLVLVAVAVFAFIYFGSIKEGFSILLKIGDYSKEKKEEDKVIGAVAAIVWPLAVCIFLVSGLVFNKWHINWIVFPITGLLFGMFSAACSIIKGNKK